VDHREPAWWRSQYSGVEDPTSELRARVLAGDADAFGEVFDVCARLVYNHAFRLTGDWTAAEDVMAMTFLEAWRGRARLVPDGGSLRPWLLGIATNLARGQRRTAHRERSALARIAAPDESPDFADDVIGRLDDATRLAALHRALAGLRREEFEVLALCVWSGLSYSETAEALGILVGTVRSRLSRARTRLARLTDNEVLRNSPELPSTRGQVTVGHAIACLPDASETSAAKDEEQGR
jgi:RNA polymerase sigma factor (sigma-70 family)